MLAMRCSTWSWAAASGAWTAQVGFVHTWGASAHPGLRSHAVAALMLAESQPCPDALKTMFELWRAESWILCYKNKMHACSSWSDRSSPPHHAITWVTNCRAGLPILTAYGYAPHISTQFLHYKNNNKFKGRHFQGYNQTLPKTVIYIYKFFSLTALLKIFAFKKNCCHPHIGYNDVYSNKTDYTNALVIFCSIKSLQQKQNVWHLTNYCNWLFRWWK